MNLKVKEEDGDDAKSMENIRNRDELYDSAIEVVIREGRGSCSLLQRCLGIGYGRAAKLIDFMAEDGIVGEYNGSKARDVLMTMTQWEQLQGIEPDSDSEAASVAHAETAAVAAAVEQKYANEDPAEALAVEDEQEYADEQDEEYEDGEYEDATDDEEYEDVADDDEYADDDEEYEDYEEYEDESAA